MGDSIPYWAGERAIARSRPDLRIPKMGIGWYGIRGMGLNDLIHSVQLRVLFQPSPRVIVVHLGGNDLLDMSNYKIFRRIRGGLRYLAAACSEATIIWVDILQRAQWTAAQEGKRRRVNQYGRQQARLLKKSATIAVDIDLSTPGFYRPDGVHLSEVGLEFYLDTLRDAILAHI
ncbi:MAG: SGNH/GDSL hydrolase family protein [Sedimenticola sp.]